MGSASESKEKRKARLKRGRNRRTAEKARELKDVRARFIDLMPADGNFKEGPPGYKYLILNGELQIITE